MTNVVQQWERLIAFLDIVCFAQIQLKCIYDFHLVSSPFICYLSLTIGFFFHFLFLPTNLPFFCKVIQFFIFLSFELCVHWYPRISSLMRLSKTMKNRLLCASGLAAETHLLSSSQGGAKMPHLHCCHIASKSLFLNNEKLYRCIQIQV